MSSTLLKLALVFFVAGSWSPLASAQDPDNAVEPIVGSTARTGPGDCPGTPIMACSVQ
jgi:hypothetical protein